MFKVQRNEKTPNIVEFYSEEYKDGKEPEITLDEETGSLILYKTFKHVPIEINVMFEVKMKREKRKRTEDEKKLLKSQLAQKCSHSGDEIRIISSFNDYYSFETSHWWAS